VLLRSSWAGNAIWRVIVHTGKTVTLNKANQNHGKPEHSEPDPEVNRENPFPCLAEEKKPITLDEQGLPAYPPHQNHQRDHHRNQEQNVGGFPNQNFVDGHRGVRLKNAGFKVAARLLIGIARYFGLSPADAITLTSP
jgi:hypothetical protein